MCCMRFNNLVNFLAPGEYFVDRRGELIGVSAVVDVVIVDGKAWAPRGREMWNRWNRIGLAAAYLACLGRHL